MRITVLLIIAALAWIAWFASTMAVERQRNFTKADFSVCTVVRPPALGPKPTNRNACPILTGAQS